MNTTKHLETPVHGSALFSWTRGVGYAELSTLSSIRRAWDRVWRDACDVGFRIRSQRTGCIKLFVLDVAETKRDSEGEVTSWTFRSHPDREFTIEIFND